MVGTRNRFSEVLNDADHEGHERLRASELVGLAQDAAVATRPDVVIVHVGTNDLSAGVRPATVVGSIESIIFELRAGQPDVDIIVAQIIPYPTDSGEVAQYNSLISERLPAWNEAGVGRVLAADVNTGYDIDVHSRDGIHPNYVGGERMAGTFFTALEALYGAC